MTKNDHQRTIDHYGPRASAYVESSVHANGPDLDEMERCLAGRHLGRVLDLGCGGGHVSYRAAPYAEQVIACDLTPAMITAVEATAAARGIANIQGVVAPAESLPFEDASFDAVLCRFTAHHWQDLLAGLKEASRVTKNGGLFVFIDGVAPAERAADTHLQVIEYLRDPSHVRNYSLSEWTQALGTSGFVIESQTLRALSLDFASWTQRTETPSDKIAMLQKLQSEAGESVQRQLAIQEDGGFDLETVTFVGSKR